MMGSASRFAPTRTPCGRSRREFLWEVGGGFAGLALIDLLSRDGYFAGRAAGQAPASPLAPREPHFPVRAKHAIFLFMNGGPSQAGTFDPKPELTRLHRTADRGDTPTGSTRRPSGHHMPTPFTCP